MLSKRTRASPPAPVKRERHVASAGTNAIVIMDSESDADNDNEDDDNEIDEEEGPKRIRTTDMERTWIEPWYQEFMRLPQKPRGNAKLTAFKEKFTENFLKEFKFKSNIRRHRDRAIRYLYNKKRHDPRRKITKKDSDVITKFFGKHRKITGRRLYLQQHCDDVRSRVLERKRDEQSSKGLTSTVEKQMWDALDEKAQREWERRAAHLNMERNDGISDDDIDKNQSALHAVLEQLLTALLGRGQSYSVGDAVFHLQYAYRSVEGDTVTRFIDVGHEGSSFYDSKYYKGKFERAWKDFAQDVLKVHREYDDSESEDCGGLRSPAVVSVGLSNPASLADTVVGSLECESSEIQDALELDVGDEPFDPLPLSADVLQMIATATVASQPPTPECSQTSPIPVRSQGRTRKRPTPSHSETPPMSAAPKSHLRQDAQHSVDPEPLQYSSDTYIQGGPSSPTNVEDPFVNTANEETRRPQKKRRITKVLVPVESEPIAMRKRARVSKAPNRMNLDIPRARNRK